MDTLDADRWDNGLTIQELEEDPEWTIVRRKEPRKAIPIKVTRALSQERPSYAKVHKELYNRRRFPQKQDKGETLTKLEEAVKKRRLAKDALTTKEWYELGRQNPDEWKDNLNQALIKQVDLVGAEASTTPDEKPTEMLKIWAEANTFTIRATLDSGSQGNLVSRQWVEAMKWAGIQPRDKKRAYSACDINSQNIQARVDQEIEVNLDINGHQEKIVLDILDLSRHKVVLGIP